MKQHASYVLCGVVLELVNTMVMNVIAYQASVVIEGEDILIMPRLGIVVAYWLHQISCYVQLKCDASII